ncbi:acetyltransferase NSI [Chlorella sorokiniana]|uniref:Acetyltransferase NSI n=1 Tax=Chlorella sorokiniana TaxID=3076 RepID=A0A2P6TYU1_CHLSO|nr:acetyltransferase NSI [Chlorella sorokiniana]|eukprot:PRW59231.1 acetyltransferase NSI [Chlorella sorokiniana]
MRRVRSNPGSWQTCCSSGRRVLVGFARAVGDAALVATLHDVAVLPELQGLGLGRSLLVRLLRQLDASGIVDVGLLAPDASRGFFAACDFGRDTEESTVMTLSGPGVAARRGQPLRGMAVHLKGPAQAQWLQHL